MVMDGAHASRDATAVAVRQAFGRLI